jgi:hypothetical protein
MPKVIIEVEVEEEHADEGDSTGLTNDAYERLTEPMEGPLGWLGEVTDVRRAK